MRKRRFKGSINPVETTSTTEKAYLRLLSWWTLKTLVDTPVRYHFFKEGGFEDEQIMQLVGLVDIDVAGLSKKELYGLLQQQFTRASQQSGSYRCSLTRNIKALGRVLSLSPCEQDILAIAVSAVSEQVLQDVFKHLGMISTTILKQVLSKLLGYSVEEIGQALGGDGVLIASGFLTVAPTKEYFQDKIEVLDGLGELLFQPAIEPNEVFTHFFTVSEPGQLTIEDFGHLQTDIELLTAYLPAVIKHRKRGVNVLIHGLPGTGKTQFVKSLAAAIQVVLYEINVHKTEGEPLSGQSRFSAYQLCQRLLGKSQGLILFDEIEDVFPDQRFSQILSAGESNKGWINQVLETNPNPTFWLCNAVDQIDPAYRRRFDYVLEMKIPPQIIRQQIIERSLESIGVDREWIRHLAGYDRITPALLQQSVRVTRLIQAEKTVDPKQVLTHLINQKLQLLGVSDKVDAAGAETIGYRLEHLNLSVDLTRLIDGLKRGVNSRICLYGPSGTGKTALVRYLAHTLGKPLVQKRASDLLSKWVGGTEKRVAEMFAQGSAEDGILLLDEADSFLRDRKRMDRSWEITLVNEVLVQMENYQGLFVCSTNLMDDLDPASLRRFDFKIRFAYLSIEQRLGLFEQLLVELGGQMSTDGVVGIRPHLEALNNLTPGDFALIKRRYGVTASSADERQLLKDLQEESRMKEDQPKTAIGFRSAPGLMVQTMI